MASLASSEENSVTRRQRAVDCCRLLQKEENGDGESESLPLEERYEGFILMSLGKYTSLDMQY